MSGKYPNSGTLNKNDRKETEKHADYRGQCEIDGVGYWIDAWIKPSKDGGKFMSLSFKSKEARAPQPVADDARTEARFREAVKQTFAIDDDVPFAPEFR